MRGEVPGFFGASLPNNLNSGSNATRSRVGTRFGRARARRSSSRLACFRLRGIVARSRLFQNGSAPRTIERESTRAAFDFEKTFRSAAFMLAVLVALVFVANKSGGLSIPLTVVIDLHSPQTEVSMSSAEPNESAEAGADEKVVTTVRLTKRTAGALDSDASRLRIKRSEVVRRILDEHYGNSPAPTAPSPDASPSLTAAELKELNSLLLTVRGQNALLCNLITKMDERQVGQNHVLDAFLRAVCAVGNQLGVFDTPHEPEQVRRFSRKHLKLE